MMITFSKLKKLSAPGFLAAVVFLMSCSSSDNGEKSLTEELEALNLDKYIDSVPYTSTSPVPYGPDTTWNIYSFDTSVCKCVFEGDFHIGVKNKTATGNVVFLMSGGGACWPGKDSCAKDADYMTGWEDSSGNPLNGWSVIHVPYCDGSVHMGDNDAEYDGNMHYHRGLKLTTAGIKIMRDLYPDPPKIMITGCSAGGYGTFIAYLLVRSFFPDAKIYIFNDSGPGLWNPGNGMKELVIDTWQFSQYIPASCTRCDDQVMYLYDWILHRDPNARIGLFSSYYDHTIGGSFLDMLPADFRDLLVSTSDFIHSKYPDRFNRFLIDDTTHCVGEVTENYLYSVDGVTIVDWISGLVDDDPDWPDVLE